MAASPLAAALLGGGGETNMLSFADPEIALAGPNLQLGQALLQSGLSSAPATPAQAIGRLAQVLSGRYLQNNSLTQLSQAYGRSADQLAKIFPPNTPLGQMLNSPDPLTRMMGAQMASKAALMGQEFHSLSPGQVGLQGTTPAVENTRPRSPEAVLQEDLNNAGGRPSAPTTIGSVIGGGTGQAGKAPATSVPANPLQGAIETSAAQAGAKKAAEERATAGVEYSDYLKPQEIPQGPGGTEPVPVMHTDPRTSLGEQTLIPGLKDQGPIPQSPAALKEAIPAWQKTETGLTSGLAAGQDALQRLHSIADAFKTINTGWGTEQKAQINAMLKTFGLPELLPNSSPAAAEQALHENYVQTLKRLQESVQGTGGRFTQMEFKLLSENAEHPNLQPEANLRMLSEDMAQIKQANSLARDWTIAKSQYGWKNPQSFTEAWMRQNPIAGYVDAARKEIGPLKGMEGTESAPPAKSASTATDPASRFRELTTGGLTKEQAYAKMHAEGY